MTLRLPATLALTAVLGAGTIAPGPAGAAAPGPTNHDGILVGLLLPFADHTERGIVHLTVRQGSSRLVVSTASGDDQATYTLRLSTRSCAGVRRNPARPRFIGPTLAGPGAFMDTYFDDSSVVGVTRRHARATRSIVLVAHDASGKFEPRACGAVYELKDVLVSS
jgi:hypothetical protein